MATATPKSGVPCSVCADLIYGTEVPNPQCIKCLIDENIAYRAAQTPAERAHDDAVEKAWTDLSERVTQNFGQIKAVQQTIREIGRVPGATVVELIDTVSALYRDVSHEPLLEKDEKSELLFLARTQGKFLTYIRNNASKISAPDPQRLAELIDGLPPTEKLGVNIENFCAVINLLLLSKVSSPGYWPLAERLHTELLEQISKTDVSSKYLETVRDLRSVLYSIVPSFRFKNDKHIVPTISKYAWRTTEVRGIYSGGLPGLGKP